MSPHCDRRTFRPPHTSAFGSPLVSVKVLAFRVSSSLVFLCCDYGLGLVYGARIVIKDKFCVLSV